MNATCIIYKYTVTLFISAYVVFVNIRWPRPPFRPFSQEGLEAETVIMAAGEEWHLDQGRTIVTLSGLSGFFYPGHVFSEDKKAMIISWHTKMERVLKKNDDHGPKQGGHLRLLDDGTVGFQIVWVGWMYSSDPSFLCRLGVLKKRVRAGPYI